LGKTLIRRWPAVFPCLQGLRRAPVKTI
jgi:hypothetical protein